jgi:hypothetical protein
LTRLLLIREPTKYEFNLKTAKALGLTIPETLLATAHIEPKRRGSQSPVRQAFFRAQV